MKLNADLSKPAAVQSNDIEWVPSPLKGVERRMLDRDGEEVARATSIVRYAPGSHFSPHTHGGGEEFFVLRGIFSDETGDFPEGFYVRNPVGSRHRPSSLHGCDILVKLHQMDPQDQNWVRIDTSREPWRRGAMAGIEVKPLHVHGSEQVGLVRLAPGTRIDGHEHPGGAEFLVLAGDLSVAGEPYGQGAWIRRPPGDRHDMATRQGCELFVKLGHLVERHTDRQTLVTLA